MTTKIVSHPKRYKLIINSASSPVASSFNAGYRDLSEARGFMGGELGSL